MRTRVIISLQRVRHRVCIIKSTSKSDVRARFLRGEAELASRWALSGRPCIGGFGNPSQAPTDKGSSSRGFFQPIGAATSLQATSLRHTVPTSHRRCQPLSCMLNLDTSEEKLARIDIEWDRVSAGKGAAEDLPPAPTRPRSALPGVPRVQTLVGRFALGAGSVALSQTFVLGGQTVVLGGQTRGCVHEPAQGALSAGTVG